MNKIQEKLKLVPAEPGVYVMQAASGEIIYIGKAVNLKNRVRQYFYSGVKTEKTMALASNIADFYYIITASEVDALALENNLIKKHKPKYNILLKDDKTYPYIKIDINQDYPTFTVSRKIKKDGAKYFGPYMGGVSVREILEIIQLAFQIRPCQIKFTKRPQRECLNFHINRCLAPCTQRISKGDYHIQVNKAIEFLSGTDDEVEKILTEKMQKFSESENFELALDYRDKLTALKKIKERKITSLNSFLNADIIAMQSNSIYIAFNILITRNGRMQGGKYFSQKAGFESGAQALSAFITQYYLNNELPDEIITQEVESSKLLKDYFKKNYDKSVHILNPKQGVRRQLLEMSEVNALEYLDKQIDKIKHREDMTVLACERIQKILNLENYPKRMECFDISNISGVDKVGSMAVFIDGEKHSESYRRFKIKTVKGADDYKSLQEVLRRRLLKLKDGESSFPKPNLIVIDGGKGQLSAVKEIFDELSISGIDLISVAEKNEEIFTLNSGEGVILEKSDYALRLLQRIRDEAHRFAVSYHRSLRSKTSFKSVLTDIDGIGEKRRAALMARFKSIDGILSANLDDIAAVKGIGRARAEKIKSFFKENI